MLNLANDVADGLMEVVAAEGIHESAESSDDSQRMTSEAAPGSEHPEEVEESEVRLSF